MQPWFTLYWTSMLWSTDTCKTRYLLTSITWPYRGLKLTAHQGQVFFEVDRWPGAGFSIVSRAHVWLTCWKQGRIVREAVNAHRGLTFSSMQMFLLLFLCIWWLLKLKTEGQTIYRNLSAKLQSSNQNSTFSWVSLIRLWTTRSRSYAFRLA